MKRLLILLMCLVGCNRLNERFDKEPKILKPRASIAVDEQFDGKEVELPSGGILVVNLPCDWPNQYTWQLTKPFKQSLNHDFSDFRVDDKETMSSIGVKMYFQRWQFFIYLPVTLDFIYYKRDTTDNFAKPAILKKYSIKVKTNNKPLYQ